MSTKKIVTATIILLLLANLGLLAFIVMKPHHPKKGTENGGPKSIIIKRLGFDKKQSETFSGLVKLHREKIIKIDEKIKTDKKVLYSLLGGKILNTTKADSLTSNIAMHQKEIELLHFNHFKELKTLCKGNQVEKFNELSNDLANIFNRKGKKNGRRKNE